MKQWQSADGRMRLFNCDCMAAMKAMPDNSADSIVTDPPYGLSFMGKKWDYDVPSEDVWRECLRVLKPGGHLLAFAGTRTQHRMAVRIEDAGFEIRDMIAWVYGSGFPKSLDVGKAIDKAAGAEREVVGVAKGAGMSAAVPSVGTFRDDAWVPKGPDLPVTAPATEAAKQWDGWGTALKPALEPITVARKLFSGTVTANVLEHGTGAINVDGCRITTDEDTRRNAIGGENGLNGESTFKIRERRADEKPQPQGRWPANLIHDGSDEVVGLFPHSKSGAMIKPYTYTNNGFSLGAPAGETRQIRESSEGSAARFFYCAKASKRDRDEGCEGMESQNNMRVNGPRESEEAKHATKRSNHHPTVKPTDLMRYLCRLVTPPGGTVLDPFMGSGSTGKAAMLEGFSFIGCELDADFVEIARARIEYALNHPHECEDERQLDLFATPPPQTKEPPRDLFG